MEMENTKRRKKRGRKIGKGDGNGGEKVRQGDGKCWREMGVVSRAGGGVFMFECQRRGGDPFLKGSFGGGGADGTDAGELLLAGRQADGTKRLQIAAIRPSRKSEYQSDRPHLFFPPGPPSSPGK